MKATPLVLLLLLVVLLPMLLPRQAVSAPLSTTRMATTLAQAATPSLITDMTTIQRIRQRGNLLLAGVLVDQPPFGYRNEQGEISGFDVDVVRALATEWGVAVRFVPVTPATRLQSLATGQVDLVAAALPHTYAAEALIDFSAHYFVDTPAFLARRGTSLSALTALAGKTIAVVQGDDALAALQAARLTTVAAPTVTSFPTYPSAFAAVTTGQATVLLAYHAYLTAISAVTPDVAIELILPASQPFALGVAQGDGYFRTLVDATLVRLQQNGKLAALYQQWLPDRQPPAMPLVAGTWPYTFANTPGGRQPSPTRLTQIQQRGKLLVGVAYDLAPFGFVGERGTIQGFDIDLSREFARRWLGDAAALELVRVTPETAIPLLRAGQVDLIIAALPLTWHNRALIDFSQSYFVDGQSVLTRADSPVQHLADLDQKVVAVSSGLESVNELTTLIMGSATGAPVAPTVLPFQEIRSAQQALLLGQVDAVIGSSVALAQIGQANPALKIALADFTRQSYAIGVPPFDAPLRDQVNFTLQAMAADGIYGSFYQRWFGATPEPLALWFADSAVTDPATQAQQPTIRLAVLAATPTPVVPILQPTATSALGTAPTQATAPTVLLLSPAPTATRADQRFTLQPTATPLATLATTPTSLALRPVLLATGTTAPVVADALFPVTVTTSLALPNTATIRTGLNANARRAPATTSPILAVLAGGTQWPLVAIAPDGQWVAVQLPDRVQAWVAVHLLAADDGLAAILATPTTLPPTPPAGLPHRVQATDTLAGLAKAYYGEQRHWRFIYEANRAAIGDDPNALPVGVELVIPPLPE